MANIDFDKTPFITPKDAKTFGTTDDAVDFLKAFGADEPLKRTLSALQRGPLFSTATTSSPVRESLPITSSL